MIYVPKGDFESIISEFNYYIYGALGRVPSNLNCNKRKGYCRFDETCDKIEDALSRSTFVYWEFELADTKNNKIPIKLRTDENFLVNGSYIEGPGG